MKYLRCRDEEGVVHAATHKYPCEADTYCSETRVRCVSFWPVDIPLLWLTCPTCIDALTKELGLDEESSAHGD